MSARRLLAAGALLTALGIALAGTAPILGTDGAARARSQQLLGGVVVVLGWASLAWGIHRFGRGAAG
ncbi:MAG TPA: hypothetical protein VIF15_01615 [Polyangiaceae bacterium]